MNKMKPEECANELEELKNGHIVENDPFYNKLIDYAASILRRVAASELKPVIHAHWFEDTEPADGDIRCSNCGIAWPICVQKYLQHVGVKKWTNFLKICPDCGALMDEKDDSHG